ncbi:MAG: patatin-like phospholipase family protein [Xanthomonadales bacterium]|nr:patatin-like phospholipase family protein [Xanthomonadales bacterium]
MSQEISIALVLGSGAARGMAHIGVIDWLNEHDIRIESIAGCSIGAVVGGIYAAGALDDYRNWVCALDEIDVIRMLDFSFDARGLVKGEKILETLRELTGDKVIEDLPIRFTAVASDIEREEEIWLTEGSLFDAIRASFAIPTVFKPHPYRNRLLFDGGLLNPLPIAPTFGDPVDYRVAVNLNGPPSADWDKPVEHREKGDDEDGYRQRIADFISRLGLSDKPRRSDGNLVDIALASLDTMQGSITRMKLAAYPPDCTISIPRNRCRAHEFYRAEELIEFGYETAERQLSDLLADRERDGGSRASPVDSHLLDSNGQE